MKDANRKAMWAKHNSSSVVDNPKDRYVWYDHKKALENAKFENLKSIPKNAPQSIKYCSRCGKSHDSSQSKHGDGMQLPLCNGCHAKGLKPLGYPAHWVWNKLSLDEKLDAINSVNNSGYNVVDVSNDFADLPKVARNRLRLKWGIEPEK